jgi:asparagine synthase (glutamine-hydrolysing)
MCGIAGIVSNQGVDPAFLKRMTSTLRHRGPDDEGIWLDEECGVGLGHRRLSIVDLSPAGHQPMHSAGGRYVLTFNGEIYNHSELRKALEEKGAVPENGWRGHSDTEVFLHAIALWGLEKAVERSVGMFALALWDRKERMLSLVRDRFGEKPLYYGWVGNDLLFASELKAFRAHPRFHNQIDRNALRLFTARTYIPAPLSIYQRIFKVPPSCILKIAPGSEPRDVPPNESELARDLSLTRYWSYRDAVRSGLEQPISNEADALKELERTLASAIRGQSMADVPVGAFLSGGIDSSTVVAMYQKYSSIRVRTFSIGFEEAGFNEAEHAKAVAQHLGTVHAEHYVTVREAREVIPMLPTMYDEPFADSSQIPTFLVSRFARQQVTVALTGDGGDEFFGGYNRHFAAPEAWQRLQMLPLSVRRFVGRPLSQVPPSVWNRLPGNRRPNFGAKIQKGLRLAGSARSIDDVYRSFLDEWALEDSPVLNSDAHAMCFDLDLGQSAPDELRMMYCDAVSYLPDDILCKVDRASMAVSLETRVPFLDHRVAEVAARIPLSMKIRNGKGKHILRELLYRHAPRKLFDRPKAGFAIPIGEWLRGPLKDWAEDLLDPHRLAEEGWFDPVLVRKRWDAHLSGRRDSTPALWAILMFQAWYKHQSQPRSEAAPMSITASRNPSASSSTFARG